MACTLSFVLFARERFTDVLLCVSKAASGRTSWVLNAPAFSIVLCLTRSRITRLCHKCIGTDLRTPHSSTAKLSLRRSDNVKYNVLPFGNKCVLAPVSE